MRPAEVVENGNARARNLVRALPSLLVTGGILYDILTHPARLHHHPLLHGRPIAALLASLRTTLLTGLAALVTTSAVQLRFGPRPNVSTGTEIVTVVTVAVLALVINRGDQRLASAREIAEATQRAVLGPAARIGGFDIAARYEAAQEDAFIGGDLYAVQDTPHGVRLMVGDVRGKGVDAGAATLLFYTDGLSEARDTHGRFYDPACRRAGRRFPDPDALLVRVSADVRRHSGGRMTDDMALLAVRRP